MSHLKDYSDSRNKQWCIHCHSVIQRKTETRDHVPSKALLEPPLPPNLPVVGICAGCNNHFSLDEEYLMVFLAVVLAGSSDPHCIEDSKIKNILQRNPNMRHRIERSKVCKKTPVGQDQIFWKPELDRIANVFLKNAKGHVMYELGEPMLEEPDIINILPLASMSDNDRLEFEMQRDGNNLWPEVGSRMMSRIVENGFQVSNWIIVQENVYRYSISYNGEIRVKTVLREYLASEIVWY